MKIYAEPQRKASRLPERRWKSFGWFLLYCICSGLLQFIRWFSCSFVYLFVGRWAREQAARSVFYCFLQWLIAFCFVYCVLCIVWWWFGSLLANENSVVRAVHSCIAALLHFDPLTIPLWPTSPSNIVHSFNVR